MLDPEKKFDHLWFVNANESQVSQIHRGHIIFVQNYYFLDRFDFSDPYRSQCDK